MPLPPSAPLDDAAIERLLDRDQLRREPYGDTCCGEGAIGLTAARWAELDGRPPAELVLTLQEYVGEGCIADHHHVYDVSGAEPRSVGVLSDDGYAVFPYLDLVDLDGDGAAELLSVGPNAGGTLSRVTVHGLADGALVQRGPALELGEVYLPFDVDRDGALELVALAEGAVTAVEADGRPADEPVERWLPEVYAAAVADPELRRPDPALALLATAMQERGLAPRRPRQVFDVVLDRLETAEDPYPVAQSVWWAPSAAQQARLDASLRGPLAEPAAWLALGVPGDHGAVTRWLTAAADRGTDLPSSALLHHLDPAGQQAVCDHVGGLLLGDHPSGDVAFWALPTLGCPAVTLAVLEAEGAPHQVARAALASVDRHGAPAADVDRWQAALVAHLQGADPVLAAEAARALRAVGDARAVLRSTLAANLDPEVRRSALVALAELPPGPPDEYLALLATPLPDEVRRRLHGELARSADPAVASLGLARVDGASDYGAWHWRAVYRTDSVPEPIRRVLRDDAARRLADPDPRVRQAAAQVLGALGPAGHEAALKRLADGDEVDWVRSAAALALGR